MKWKWMIDELTMSTEWQTISSLSCRWCLDKKKVKSKHQSICTKHSDLAEQRFSTREQFCPLKNIGSICRHFCFMQLEEGYWHLADRVPTCCWTSCDTWGSCCPQQGVSEARCQECPSWESCCGTVFFKLHSTRMPQVSGEGKCAWGRVVLCPHKFGKFRDPQM